MSVYPANDGVYQGVQPPMGGYSAAQPGGVYPNQPYPGQQMPGHPAQQMPGYPTQQASGYGGQVAYGAPAMNQGYYPPASCQHSVIKKGGPTCCGICCGILFFPAGLICCLLMREKRCAQCGQSMD